MDKTKPKKLWTKSEITKVLDLWEGTSIDDIALAIGRARTGVQYVANRVRKSGYPLPKKHKLGILDNLIKEVLVEKKLIRK